jgi:hypothetical protein
MIHGVQISAVTRRIIVIVSDSLSLYHDQMPDRNNIREKKKIYFGSQFQRFSPIYLGLLNNSGGKNMCVV